MKQDYHVDDKGLSIRKRVEALLRVRPQTKVSAQIAEIVGCHPAYVRTIKQRAFTAVEREKQRHRDRKKSPGHHAYERARWNRYMQDPEFRQRKRDMAREKRAREVPVSVRKLVDKRLYRDLIKGKDRISAQDLWYRNRVIPALGMTAQEAVAAGQLQVLRKWLKAYNNGAYA